MESCVRALLRMTHPLRSGPRMPSDVQCEGYCVGQPTSEPFSEATAMVTLNC